MCVCKCQKWTGPKHRNESAEIAIQKCQKTAIPGEYRGHLFIALLLRHSEVGPRPRQKTYDYSKQISKVLYVFLEVTLYVCSKFITGY